MCHFKVSTNKVPMYPQTSQEPPESPKTMCSADGINRKSDQITSKAPIYPCRYGPGIMPIKLTLLDCGVNPIRYDNRQQKGQLNG